MKRLLPNISNVALFVHYWPRMSQLCRLHALHVALPFERPMRRPTRLWGVWGLFNVVVFFSPLLFEFSCFVLGCFQWFGLQANRILFPGLFASAAISCYLPGLSLWLVAGSFFPLAKMKHQRQDRSVPFSSFSSKRFRKSWLKMIKPALNDFVLFPFLLSGETNMCLERQGLRTPRTSPERKISDVQAGWNTGGAGSTTFSLVFWGFQQWPISGGL